MAWRGSFSRSAMSNAFRRSASSSPRFRPPPISAPRRRLPFSNLRKVEALGCAQSLMPLHSFLAGARLTDVSPRAYSELSHGTFRRTCQDR